MGSPAVAARRRLSYSCWLVLLVAIGALNADGARAQNADAKEYALNKEYQIKAAFLYKFCFYVDWPAAAFADATSPLVLGVAGADALVQELREVVDTHTINGRPINVRHITADSDLNGLHLLFIARSEQSREPQLLAQVQGRPVLVVTETPAELGSGSSINFAVENNRIRFDVDLTTTERRDLRLSAQLLKVARAIREGATP
jgi:hypothetical protein